MTTITLEKAVNRLKAKAAQVAKTQEVLNTLLGNHGLEYIDDHNGGNRVQSLKDWVLVEYNDQLCPFPTRGMGACLNPLYLDDDGKVHLSRMSIGPYFPTVEKLTENGVKYYTI